MRPLSRVALSAALGAGLALPLDALHLVNGTTAYPGRRRGQPWWSALLFAGAGVAMVEGHRILARALGRRPPPADAWEAAAATLSLVAAYGSSAWLGRKRPAVALAAYAGLFAGAAARAHPEARHPLLAHAAGAALVGPLVEAALVRLGRFRYTRPDLLGVPRWLPAVYLHGALAGAALDRWLGAPSRERAALRRPSP